jgi:hypothetical protein
MRLPTASRPARRNRTCMRGGRTRPSVMDAMPLAVRRNCPGTLAGVPMGAWIEGSEWDTVEAIDGWNEVPDHGSVKPAEPASPAVC